MIRRPTFAGRYTDRIEELERTPHEVEPHDGWDRRTSRDVRSLSGRETIETHTTRIVAETTDEHVVGRSTLTERLYDTLEAATADEPSIGTLAMADRNVVLVNCRIEHGSDEGAIEAAVYGRGFSNGFVAIARRLLVHELLSEQDPAQ